MKILFVVTGIGLGHATRIDAIINELKLKDEKLDVRLACYKSSYEYFSQKNFKTIKLHGSNYSSNTFNINIFNIVRLNLKFPLNFRRDLKLIIDEINNFDPEYIIVDWDVIGLIAAARTHKKSVLIFNYDPYSLENFIKKFKMNGAKKIQNKFVESIYRIAEDRSDAIFIPGLKKYTKKKYHFIDFIIRDIPENIPDKQQLMTKLKLKKEPILVMLGGSNFGYSLFEKMKEVMFKLKNEEFIVFGYERDFTIKNITGYRFKSNYLEYLKASKGVIMMAGHSSFAEAAIFKKPCLVFPIRNHVEQILNAYTIENTGIGIVRYLDSIDKESLNKDIINFLDNLQKLQLKANKLKVRSYGAKQVANFLLSKRNFP